MARRAQRQNAAHETLKGELVAFSVRTADLWGTGTVRTTANGGDVTITGKILGARLGDTVEMTGVWSEHPKYGRQFKVYECAVAVPQDASGVIGWLTTLPEIGRRRAELLVQAHGVEGTWRVLDARDAEALTAIDGINDARAAEIFDAYHARKADRDRVVRLKSWGLTDNQIARVIQTWGDDAEAELESNPYRLSEAVDGFGWERADAVARRMGVANDSPARIAAGVMHAMSEAVFAGHCYVPAGALARLVASEKVCGTGDEAAVRKAIDGLVERGRLVRHGTGIYLPSVAEAEADLAIEFSRRSGK